MNPRLDTLQPYPFEKLARLVADVTPNPDRSPISLAIGEPQHPPAACARTALVEHLDGIAHYPPTPGGQALREAISDWLIKRFNIPAQCIDPERHILPAAGTREALFSFAQALIDDRASPTPRVAMPNPGYQIYEGAALLAGAQPLYMPCLPETGFLADLDAPSAADWDRVQLLYLCSPGNPTGAVADLDYFKQALALADRHDFVIASDECYSEIYPDESAPPPGLLQAAAPGATIFRAASSFTACPSAPICRACGPASSPATHACSPISCAIAPTTARPSGPTSRPRASPPGATRPTCAPTATAIARNTTP